MLFISACGTNDQVAEGGIGGTGITMGRIEALGSIVVNGVKYDTSEATFIRDGQSVDTQDDFVTGEVITLTGSTNNDGVTGKASSVVFADILEGPVAVKPELLASSVEVMGQIVSIDDLTILHGFNLISDLEPNDIIEVSGFVDANREIHASSITKKNTIGGLFEIKGVVSQLKQDQKTFKIGNLTIDFSAVSISIESLVDAQDKGQNVQVLASELTGLILKAGDIQLLKAVELLPETEVETEGFITRFASINDFDINGLRILTNSNTTFKDGIANELALNVLTEVEGVINSDSVLVADSVSLLKTEHLTALEANIDAVDKTNKTLDILGNIVQVNANTVYYDESVERDRFFSFDDITPDTYMDVKVSREPTEDGRYIALRVSREDQETTISFKGVVSSINLATGTFGLFNLDMITLNTTTYTYNKQPVDRARFFEVLEQGVSFVEVEGQLAGGRTDSRAILLESVAIVDVTN